jgi:hypothetical protein
MELEKLQPEQVVGVNPVDRVSETPMAALNGAAREGLTGAKASEESQRSEEDLPDGTIQPCHRLGTTNPESPSQNQQGKRQYVI